MISAPVGTILRDKGGHVWSVPSTVSVLDAITVMAERSLGALLVIDEGNLVGIISERDYARKVVLQGRSSKDTLVGEIMVTPVVAVTPVDTVEECMRMMTMKRIRHLPVVQNGKVIGIVSIGDLVRKVVSVQGEIIQQLHEYISGRASV